MLCTIPRPSRNSLRLSRVGLIHLSYWHRENSSGSLPELINNSAHETGPYALLDVTSDDHLFAVGHRLVSRFRSANR